MAFEWGQSRNSPPYTLVSVKQRFIGWTAYFFTADIRFPTLLRLSPSRRVPLFNGAIECRLYEFLVVAGSMRSTRRTAKDRAST